jgi:hypothetical protein
MVKIIFGDHFLYYSYSLGYSIVFLSLFRIFGLIAKKNGRPLIPFIN